MAGGKQTPRQRMINILYLVLLGLIALNVPDSLLDAFKNITLSLDQSSGNVKHGIDATFATFENTKLKDDPARAKPILDTAKMAAAAADELYNYVKSIRDTLVEAEGGIDPSTGDVKSREDLDISPRVMIDKGKAKELKDKINATRQRLLSLLRPSQRNGVNFSLNAVDPPASAGIKKTWEEAYFGDGIPLGATLTTLAKIQTDTKNAENEVVKNILGEADQAVVNLNHFDAVAVAPSSYVLVGQPYTADVFLTAYDSKLTPQITVNGSNLQVQDGKGKYVGSTSAEGLHTWTATINVKQTNGTIKQYTTSPQTYMVARPSAVVSPDKMNVLYIGVPNPVSISAPGVAMKDLRVSMSGGTITGSNGHYEARVTTIGTATVNVAGELTKGKISPLGSTLFRVKRIPDPKAEFAGKSGGNTSAANLRAQDRIFAKLDNFEFDARFNVTRFTLMVAKPRQDVIIMSATGSQLTSQMRSVMNTVTPGTTVIFKDIIAVGPDGSQRGLDNIALIAD